MPVNRVRVAAAIVIVTVLWLLYGWWTKYSHVTNLGAPGNVVDVLGDSIPAGFGDGVGPEHAWPTVVSSRIGVRFINHSIAGDTTEKGLARLDDVLADHPRLVVVELGGNDMLQRAGADAMKHNLETIFARIQASGAMVAYVSVPAPLAGDYETAWREACATHGVWFVRNVLKGVIADPRLMVDSIHPNAQGQQAVADRLAPELDALLAAGDRRRGGR